MPWRPEEDWPIPNRDVFALDRMGLNAFLFAEIGTEPDGSRLTILSALARLGRDPWETAADWAKMSRAAAGEALSACIAQMPVGPEDLAAAPATAARLITLLAGRAATPERAARRMGARPKVAVRILVASALAVILLGAAVLASHSGMFAQTSPLAPAPAPGR